MENIHAVYNSVFSYIDEIKISPLSRAYTFSDSVYEVIPYFDGVPLCFKMHMERLKLSLEMSGINVDMAVVQNEIQKLALELSSKNGYVYFQISRGVADRDHSFYKTKLIPVLVITTKKFKNDFNKIQIAYQKIRLKRIHQIQLLSERQGLLNHLKNPFLIFFRNLIMKF